MNCEDCTGIKVIEERLSHGAKRFSEYDDKNRNIELRLSKLEQKTAVYDEKLDNMLGIIQEIKTNLEKPRNLMYAVAGSVISGIVVGGILAALK